ncbi:MAG: hypothetical protein IT294_14430 [Deltaproteobacteria bacterium]|nr:hypothetical protein [Deltaproteobacteria bacterium]
MQDRPDASELLEAVRAFLDEQVVPALEGTTQFHARVAANVLAIVAREIVHGERSLRAEWGRLVALLEKPASEAPASEEALRTAVRELNAELVERMRAGATDQGPWDAAVLAHLRATAAERLAIANPKYAEQRRVE